MLAIFIYSHTKKMARRVASSDPPMTLARRQELQETRIPFRVIPHGMVFTPSLEEIWTKEVNSLDIGR
jgi:hypothetical protein